MQVKRINHIAIVVPDIEEALAFYQDTLGLTLEYTEHVVDQDVIVAFLPTGDSEIELVEPVDPSSGVARFMAKHGSGIHHICLEVDNLHEALVELAERGVQLINEQPTVGSGGKLVAFIHPDSTNGVLVELYESTEEEAQRRVDNLNDLAERLRVEGQAVAAGVRAFLRALRWDASQDNEDGIRLKPGQNAPS